MPDPGPKGSDDISTFVTCLRLLSLNLLDDWPGITEQTFSTKFASQNLQHRVKCVEWSLFRLFEQFDSEEAQDVGRSEKERVQRTEAV